MEKHETVCWLERGVAAVLAAAHAMPVREELGRELQCVEAAQARGYFLPDEEELVRLRYSQYLGLRAALGETLAMLAERSGWHDAEWKGRLPYFTAAFAAACVLMRVDRFLVELAAERPVVWKKLDEADPRAGVPRKSFTEIYKAVSAPVNLRRFLSAADFYQENREGVFALGTVPVLAPVVELLRSEEARIERRRRDAVKRLVAYRWFSFLRRNRSAWKKVMFGLFEVSGRAVAELRQPGVKPRGAPKRVTADLLEGVLAQVRPGDVFVTRHDDALSNLFLPGFWPHAALFLGSHEALGALGVDHPKLTAGGCWFLESKKDGVRVRPAAETLAVDAFLVMRPPLDGPVLGEGLRRALGHEGKGYDFLFDFRTADRLVCTEVVYRGFHACGPVRFELRDVGGRLCLPAEELLDQALACGFRIIATGGLEERGLVTGHEAEAAFRRTRMA
ncbi:MAG: hypothetical protein MUF13_03880 [Akkermansiaceae bacterium]|nr:hypothetical protein [Akkermansiaceae bacterium]